MFAKSTAGSRSAFLTNEVSHVPWPKVSHVLKANSKAHSRTLESANLGLNPNSVTY